MAPVPQEGKDPTQYPSYFYLIPLELPILESLIRLDPKITAPDIYNSLPPSIRNRLTALKKDRGEFIKSSDVNQLYQAVVKQSPLLPYSTRSILTQV